jgi:putative transposase
MCLLCAPKGQLTSAQGERSGNAAQRRPGSPIANPVQFSYRAKGPRGRDTGESVMPQSLAKVVLHLVFSTKNRKPFLRDQSVRDELYAYLATVLESINCPAIKIGGMPDHIHILCLLSRTQAIASIVEEIKTSTSKWIKTKGDDYAGFYWQGGYGVFSVSESKIPDARRYVENQQEHHRSLSFQDEFRELCRRHGISIDERYAWD